MIYSKDNGRGSGYSLAAREKKPKSKTCWKPNEGDYLMLIKLLAMKNAYIRNEDGATAIEYGLLAAGIALAIIAVVFTMGPTLNGMFEDIQSHLESRS